MPKLFWHEHPVSAANGFFPGKCDYCLTKLRNRSYYCNTCSKTWHHDCMQESPKINHQSHHHPLEFLCAIPDYSLGECHFCRGRMEFFYHCSLCDFSVDLKCVKEPPRLTINNSKCHEHTLTLMARTVNFICNACGTYGERNPYVCLTCSLMFHEDCITLPRVINVNRHDHRVSHAQSLVHGVRVCEVCRQKIDWRYGAYFCFKCPSFAIHSKCATRKDVWDGVELEGIPEEVVDISPFKVIGENVINHFSHEEHNLELIADAIDRHQSIRCEACVYPISCEKHYSCLECVFLLHETCASFPRQKRHGLSPHMLSLEVEKKTFECTACDRFSNGFKYEYGHTLLDMRCASISWFLDHPCHPHTLFLTSIDTGTCGPCNSSKRYVLRCVECEFALGYECATLPYKIYHKCDDHRLSLCYGEESSSQYWCEICEAQTDPKNWFYTCQDCNVVCHIRCALGGDFANMKTGVVAINGEEVYEVVLNAGISRPHCARCYSRCQLPFIYKASSICFVVHACSFACAYWYDFLEVILAMVPFESYLNTELRKRDPSELHLWNFSPKAIKFWEKDDTFPMALIRDSNKKQKMKREELGGLQFKCLLGPEGMYDRSGQEPLGN